MKREVYRNCCGEPAVGRKHNAEQSWVIYGCASLPNSLDCGGLEGTRPRPSKDQEPVPRRIIVEKHRLFDKERVLMQRPRDLAGSHALLGLGAGGWVQDEWCNSKRRAVLSGT